MLDKRALAAARMPDDAEELALLDGQGDVVKRRRLEGRPFIIGIGEMLGYDTHAAISFASVSTSSVS